MYYCVCTGLSLNESADGGKVCGFAPLRLAPPFQPPRIVFQAEYNRTDDAPPFSAQQIPRPTPRNLITQILTDSVLHHAKTRADQPASLYLSQVTLEVTASGTEYLLDLDLHNALSAANRQSILCFLLTTPSLRRKSR